MSDVVDRARCLYDSLRNAESVSFHAVRGVLEECITEQVRLISEIERAKGLLIDAEELLLQYVGPNADVCKWQALHHTGRSRVSAGQAND